MEEVEKPLTWEEVSAAIRTLQAIPAGRWYIEELHRRAGRMLREILSHDPAKYQEGSGYRRLLQLQAAYGAYSEMLSLLTGRAPEVVLSETVTEGAPDG